MYTLVMVFFSHVYLGYVKFTYMWVYLLHQVIRRCFFYTERIKVQLLISKLCLHRLFSKRKEKKWTIGGIITYIHHFGSMEGAIEGSLVFTN
jgi:hypothetical protein